MTASLQSASRFGRVVLFALSLSVSFSSAQTALAQTEAGEQTPLERNRAAFDAMRRDPGDVTKTLAYAETSIALRDYEGAISALERLLILDPGLQSIRLELGVLYFRLGALPLARAYLTRVAEDASLPEDLRQKASAFLADINRRDTPWRFSGSVSTGFRYQSNANFAADNGAARYNLGGLVIEGSNLASTRRRDWNLFGAASLTAAYEFESATPLSVESNMLLYGQRQFDIRSLNLAFAQIDIGPRIGLPSIQEGLSVRPYLLANYFQLDASPYFQSYGGGGSVRANFDDLIYVDGLIEIQKRDYPARTQRPQVSDRNGHTLTLQATPRYALTADDAIGLSLEYNRSLARGDYESMSRYSIGPSFMTRFDSPIDALDQPWVAGFSLNRVWRQYDQPDQRLDPGTTRSDREWNLTANLTVNLTQDLSLLFQAQQSWVSSNLPNYRYSNTAFATGASFKF